MATTHFCLPGLDRILVPLAIGITLVFGSAPSAQTRPDVVVFVADDVADSDVDVVSQPSAENPKRALPSIKALAAQGVRFRRFYSHAWCAPTRDSFMRSRWFGTEHGEWACGTPVPKSLDMTAYNLAHLFQDAGYHTAHLGKWHFGVHAGGGDWRTAPQTMGFEEGLVLFPIPEECSGVPPESTLNLSGKIRDAFLDWWARTPAPRFAVVNFEAAHSPWNFPDASLLPSGYPPPLILRRNATDRQKFEAELVGLDTALGGMLSVLGTEDFVVFMGDNGTPGGAARPDQDPERVKLSCYEDGVRVPFILRGPGVPAGVESHALGHVVDLLPTLRALAGITGPAVDGVSLAVGHDLVFCHGRTRLDAAAISCRWKLLTTEAGVEELYDLRNDPGELSPLPPTGPIARFLRSRRIAALGF